MLKVRPDRRRNSTESMTKSLFILIVAAFILSISKPIIAQQKYVITYEDSLALENVIVEKYYISDSTDYNGMNGAILPIGAITYRIFIDMKPGYSLQVVYGVPQHELFLKTTTTFYNDKVCFAETGFNIDAKKLHIGNVALDSWITMGAASRHHTGILRSEDMDNYSFVTNRASLSKIDGLTKGVLPDFKIFQLDLGFFDNDSTASFFSTKDAAWAALGGVKGPTPENRVLIAQLTTNGKLTFELNVQLGTPTGGFVQFVAKNPENSEIQFDGLSSN
jgi:hypothetical protein